MTEVKHALANSALELNHTQKELLRELEFLGPLGDQDIFLVALVYLGLKPAAEVGMTFQEGIPSYSEQDYQNDIDEVRQQLKRMGLWYEQKRSNPDQNDEDQTTWVSFYISKNPQVAARLSQAFAHPNQVNEARLLGYPESAIQSFPQDSVWVDSLPELGESEVAPFLYFAPSKANWAEEIKDLEKSVQIVKKLMPNLYERMQNTFLRNKKS